MEKQSRRAKQHYLYDKTNVLERFSEAVRRFLSQQAIKGLFLHSMKCLISTDFNIFSIQFCDSSQLISHTKEVLLIEWLKCIQILTVYKNPGSFGSLLRICWVTTQHFRIYSIYRTYIQRVIKATISYTLLLLTPSFL